MEVKNKIQKLEIWFNSHPKTIIAFSGGVDSGLITFLARKFNGKQNAIAIMSTSDSLKRYDLSTGEDFCSKHDIELIKVKTNEINDPNYYTNPINRCFFCKNHLYDTLTRLRNNRFQDFEVLNGNNIDDIKDYRPGIQSATNNNILSPFIDCSIGKEEIRTIALYFKLEIWNKPASPCLSSRIPYGTTVTKSVLSKIERAENFLFNIGFEEVRVRYYFEKAMIEVPKDKIESLQNILQEVKDSLMVIGFSNVEVDTEGLVSGKLNRGINE